MNTIATITIWTTIITIIATTMTRLLLLLHLLLLLRGHSHLHHQSNLEPLPKGSLHPTGPLSKGPPQPEPLSKGSLHPTGSFPKGPPHERSPQSSDAFAKIAGQFVIPPHVVKPPPFVIPFQVVETGPVSNGLSNRNSIPSGRKRTRPNGQSNCKSISSGWNRIRVKRSIQS